MSKAKVIVVGAGGAGNIIAKTLASKLNAATHELLLINPRTYEIFWPSIVRAVVRADPIVDNGALNEVSQLFNNGNGSLKVGTVERIEPSGEKGGHVILTNGETINYAALVLAPGSIWEGPLALPDGAADARAYFDTWRAKFKNAKHVVLAGGGAVSLEIAGEIKDAYPNTKVTIVHGPQKLLNDVYPNKFRDGIAKQLQARGVEIILGDYIDSFPSEGQGVTTRNGRELDADLVVPTRGGRPNTAFLKEPFGLSETGHVIVEKTLEVKGFPGVFAAGDILQWDEQKQAAKTANHATVVVQNVLDRLAGHAPTKTYGGSSELIVVTNGKTSGLAFFGILWGVVVGPWFAKTVKSKDMMVGMHKKQLGFA